MAASGSVSTSGPKTAAQFAAEINDELALLYGRAPVQLGSVAGTDVITGSATPAASFTAYAAGQTFSFVAAANNTGAVTLNINAIGAKNLRTAAGAALVAGQLVEDTLYVVHVVPIAGPDVEFRLIGSGGGSASTGTPDVIVPFTASGTFAKADYPGARQFVVTCIGPGGAGAFANNDYPGAGGQAGGVAIKLLNPADVAASVAVTVNGTASTFDHSTPVVGNAGSNGSGPNGGAAAGTATGGDLNFTGGFGQSTFDNDGTTSDMGPGGKGGDTVGSPFGKGGRGGRGARGGGSYTSTDGSPGQGYGGGGGGGGRKEGSSTSGGAGAPGAVFVKVKY